MNVSNCPRCGRIFLRTGKKLCPDCLREDEQMYEQVYRYLRDNPKSTVSQVAEATGVSEDRVLAFLREGRIQASEWIDLEYPCERCGSMISSGRYCDDCTAQMQGSLKALAAQMQATKGSEQMDRIGYHTEDRMKKRK